MAQPADAPADPHQKLFETKCQKCHSLERVKEAHLTRDMVKPTVDRMKSKPGADISENDAVTLYERDDREIRDIQRKVGIYRDGLAVGGHIDMIVLHVKPRLATFAAGTAAKRRAL